MGIIAYMDRPLLYLRQLFVLAVAVALLACSPALNWRSVALPEAGLTLSLPCKPDRATRRVDLGAGAVELAMVGCEADDATFALSHMPLLRAGDVGDALARWRSAVRMHMRAGPDAADDAAFVPLHALAVPQSVRMTAQGRAPDGSAIVADGVWFARLEGGRARLYHAVVYARQPRQALADAFFAGLALQP